MGGTESEIPFIDLSMKGLGADEEGEEWKAVCRRVREASETQGCFLVGYDREKIGDGLREEMVVGITALFDLPEETKKKHHSRRAYSSYLGHSPVVPLHQSFGIENAIDPHVAQAFTSLMWPPHGNPSFWLGVMGDFIQQSTEL
ncbi:probable 2-oxoglutarate-dependent dioxygenase AOP1 [Malania oleifera]|uniref:probable 2-oxoglutarate-dependent dioxygenase AOP1 n=1 Tax=Malania oleifera TaxID=397392 RepID=UPI0025AE2C15|nr:probable 2-oxoglutarate-dependent dioxygenase AOP1 [Malania oleifera]